MPIDAPELLTDEGRAVGPDPRAELVSRIAASSHFRSAPRLRELLIYISERSLRDDTESLTEQQIGIHVFRRSPGYNCSEDSVVRTQARQLRLKLDAFFASDGRTEPMVVRIPKGHYVLSFEDKNDVGEPKLKDDAGTESFSLVAEASSEPSNPRQETARASTLRLYLVLVFVFAFGLGGGAVLLFRSTIRPRSMPVARLWSPFLGSEQPLVIYSNALFTGNPASGLHYSGDKDEAKSVIDTYTGVGEVAAIHDLDQLFSSQDASFVLKRSHLVTWDEARTKSIIFVGSPEENLSLGVVPTTHDFSLTTTLDNDPSGQSGLINHHPVAGEQARYLIKPEFPMKKDYAIIALVPGLSAKTWIMILAGTTTYGTQAAADYVTSAEGSTELTNALGARGGQVVPFEAALEVDMGGGVPIHTHLLLLHVSNR